MLKDRHSVEEVQVSRKKGRGRKLRYVLILIVLVLSGLGISGFFTFRTVKAQLDSGTAHFQAVINQLKNENFSATSATLIQIKQELGQAQADFKGARDSLGLFQIGLPLFNLLPGPGYDLANLPRFLDLAEKTAQIGEVSLEVIQPAVTVLETPPAPGSSRLVSIADALATPSASAGFKQASQLLNDLMLQRSNLDRSRLNLEQTRKALDQLDQQLPTLKEVLQLAEKLPDFLPGLLGKEKPVNYLAVIQNSDELRATGGFISAVGLININNGRLSLSSFQDSYAVDSPDAPLTTPPEPLSRYMNAAYLLLRDANWWPDFPTSARQLATLYQQHQGKAVDNVLAIDSQAVAYLFEALGPLDLPDYHEQLTAQNFQERLRYYYLPPGTDKNTEWWLQRKEFIKVVLNGLLERLNGASARDYLKVINRLGQALGEKHLQAYFGQTELEAQLAGYGMDGALISPNSPATVNNTKDNSFQDYLMVVDTNVGFNKINPKIERTARYSVTGGSAGSNLFASLTLTYTNHAGVREDTNPGECVKVVKYDTNYESMMNGCYWNYLRVYVPAGSKLREATGFETDNYPVSNSENGKTVFAAQIVVPPGESRSVTFNYVLAGTLASSDNYQLAVQKQAGSSASDWMLQLNLPGAAQEWKVRLERDQYFDLKKRGN
jgi:hypothetical protein